MGRGEKQKERKGMKEGGTRSFSFLLSPLLLLLLGASPGRIQAAPYELVLETIVRDEEIRDQALVEEAISEITMPLLGCTVRLETVSIEDHARMMELMVAQNQQIDIVDVGRTTPLHQMVAGGRLIPLEELLTLYGKEAGKKLESVLENGRMDGHLYMLPESPIGISKTGFVYNQRIARELGLAIKPVMTLSEIEELGEALAKEKIYLLSQGTGEKSSVLMSLLYPQLQAVDDSNLILGVYREGNLELMNLYDTPEALDYYQRLRLYVERGWMPGDTMESGLSSIDLFREEEVFMVWMDVSPINLDTQQKNYSFPLGGFYTSDPAFLYSGETQVGFGISSTCRRPELAMGFLNLIYTRTDLANLLMYGLEGLHYEVVGENTIDYPQGVDADTVGYRHRFTSFGDPLEIYQWAPVDPQLKEKVEALQKEVFHDRLWGYHFNPLPVGEKLKAVESVLKEYLPPLECGLVEEVEQAVGELGVALNRAGISDILLENQRQLDAWLSLSG